jgi:hypothetical protein
MDPLLSSQALDNTRDAGGGDAVLACGKKEKGAERIERRGAPQRRCRRTGATVAPPCYRACAVVAPALFTVFRI